MVKKALQTGKFFTLPAETGDEAPPPMIADENYSTEVVERHNSDRVYFEVLNREPRKQVGARARAEKALQHWQHRSVANGLRAWGKWAVLHARYRCKLLRAVSHWCFVHCSSCSFA